MSATPKINKKIVLKLIKLSLKIQDWKKISKISNLVKLVTENKYVSTRSQTHKIISLIYEYDAIIKAYLFEKQNSN